MFGGDLCEENKTSIEDDSTLRIHLHHVHSKLNYLYL